MSANAKNLRILFFGDITGRQGRTAVKSFIANLKEKPDFVIANIENASHGFGLTKKNYEDLSASGIDCFTSGNHIWDKKDIYDYIDRGICCLYSFCSQYRYVCFYVLDLILHGCLYASEVDHGRGHCL